LVDVVNFKVTRKFLDKEDPQNVAVQAGFLIFSDRGDMRAKKIPQVDVGRAGFYARDRII